MHHTRARLLTSSVTALAVVLATLPANLLANPTGGVVVAGTAKIDTPVSGTVNITQASDKAIIDWRTFNVAPAELVQFIQPNTSSITLNRVTGGDPSNILGAIKANGQVWLINPNGIAFGKSARVDVAGLLATTLNITNSDFMAGNYRFSATGASPASVTNAGTLTIRNAGLAALVAPSVANSGVIQARLGHIALASTNGFTLDFYGDGAVNFLLNKDTSAAIANATNAPAVSNSGSLIADGGSVLLTAATAKTVVDQTINMDGYIQARTVGTNKGTITLDAGAGSVAVVGTIDATGETGGNITVTGGAVNLASTAKLDASGDTAGGTVLVGGDEHGQGTTPTAQITSVASGALIKVNAVQSGNAGKAVVWSNLRTDFAGTIDATGGSSGGNGGFAEVSGHDLLNFTGTVDLRAKGGAQGTLLLDPRNVTISATGTTPTLPTSGAVTLNPSTDDSILQVSTLQTALGLGNVIVTTGSDGTQAGDITVASNVSWSNGSNLTLLANRNVIINDGVTIANTGAGNLNLHADSTGSGTGTVTFNGTGKVNFAATTGSTGTVSIFYNPSSYTSPTSYSSFVTGGNLTAYMLVNNVTQLQAINTNLTGTYALGKDIDASATASNGGFNPIAEPATPSDTTTFTGTFDGEHHAINALTIAPASNQDIGLFGASSGTIKDVALTNVSISAPNRTIDTVIGALVAVNTGTVSGSSVSGSVSGGNIVQHSLHVGGLVGENVGGTIKDSSSSASVSGTGGDGTISYYVFGGLVAVNQGTVLRSSGSGAVTGDIGAIGGLVGINYNSDTIDQSFSTGSVVVNGGEVGGLVGWNRGGIVSNSYSRSSVSGQNERIGGLAGLADLSATITTSYATGAVSSVAPLGVGGLVELGGFGGATITSSYWDTNTSGTTVSDGGTGQTTTQLKSGLPSGFGLSIWAIDPAINNGYPYLKWQTASVAVAPHNVSFGYVDPRIQAQLSQLQQVSPEQSLRAFSAELNISGNDISAPLTSNFFSNLEASMPEYTDIIERARDSSGKIAMDMAELYLILQSGAGAETMAKVIDYAHDVNDLNSLYNGNVIQVIGDKSVSSIENYSLNRVGLKNAPGALQILDLGVQATTILGAVATAGLVYGEQKVGESVGTYLYDSGAYSALSDFFSGRQ